MAYSEHDLSSDDLKELTRIQRLLEKHSLEVDNETEQILKYVIKGNVVNGIAKMLTKDWAINKLVQMWGEPSLSPMVKQRAFEFMCDMLGHTPTGKSQGPHVMDIVIGEAV